MPLQPDVTDLLNDPALGAQAFTIHRITKKWVKGRMSETSADIKAVGNIQPATTEDLEQIPEGDRKNGVIVVRSIRTIFGSESSDDTEGETFSDEITWRGNRYKVIKAFPWMDYGWCEAYLTRK